VKGFLLYEFYSGPTGRSVIDTRIVEGVTYWRKLRCSNGAGDSKIDNVG